MRAQYETRQKIAVAGATRLDMQDLMLPINPQSILSMK